MELRKEIWGQLESNRELRLKVALALDIQEQTVIGQINRRSDNITKLAALKAISEFTGIAVDDLVTSIENETTAAV
mgnify:CR=1 FL=1